MKPRTPKLYLVVSCILAGGFGPGCRAHSQQIALDLAVRDFMDHKPPLCASEPIMQGGPPETMRRLLQPWIAGPNRYLIEGCGYRGAYICEGEKCRRIGALHPAPRYVPPPTPAVAAGEAPSEARADQPPALAPMDDSDAATVRAALEGRRADIAACVDKLPVGVQVDFTPGQGATVSLRGPLKGKAEEACVRAALGPQFVPSSVQSAGTVIHVLK